MLTGWPDNSCLANDLVIEILMTSLHWSFFCTKAVCYSDYTGLLMPSMRVLTPQEGKYIDSSFIVKRDNYLPTFTVGNFRQK